MARIEWDLPGTRKFETGIEKGVLYVEGEEAVAWNGLVSVSENPLYSEVAPRYQDGLKTHNDPVIHEYESEITALTYPEEFEKCLGIREIYEGVYSDEQRKTPFGLAYQTGIGNHNGKIIDHKIHLIYNAYATPSSKIYSTMTNETVLEPFVWGIQTSPVTVPGHEPASHFILDINKATRHRPRATKHIYDRLFGAPGIDPRLVYPQEIINTISDWHILYPSTTTYPSLDTLPGGP